MYETMMLLLAEAECEVKIALAKQAGVREAVRITLARQVSDA